MSNFSLDLQSYNITGVSSKIFLHDIMCELELYNLPVVIATAFGNNLGEFEDKLEYDNCYEIGDSIRHIRKSSAPKLEVEGHDVIDVEYTRFYTSEQTRKLVITHNGLILVFSPDRGFELNRKDNKLILKRMDNGFYTVLEIEE